MRHSRSVTRAIVGLLAAFVSFALLVCGVAAAVDTDFETFTIGSVDGQGGPPGAAWKSAAPGDIPACGPVFGQYDQQVVPTALPEIPAPPAFGVQALRMSNSCATSEFAHQTYSSRVPSSAGEELDNKVFTAQFSFISRLPDSFQKGLFLSVSPDSYEGSRMSWVGLEDTPEGGIRVTVNDTPEVDGKFVEHDAGVLDRTVPHTISFWIKTNPGPDNDLVRIAIDGRDLGQCFTTWENYYRIAPEQKPNGNTPADINSLQFRSSVDTFAGPTGGGYLFDNVSVTTSNGPGPPGCDLVIDKEADARTVRAGGLAGYTITARNRGRGSARNVRVCDRVPRRMTFVRANRKLSRLGGRRCLVIPRLRPGQRVSLHVDFRVDASAPAGTVANIADVTPGVEPPGSPASPGAGDVPRPPAVGARVAVKRAKALVRVLPQRRVIPPVTG